jgi:large subunit ribosomal protein L18e
MRKTHSPNTHLQSLIEELRKTATVQDAPIWKRIAFELSRPTRERRIVNLSRINRFCVDNETIIVPGKVLGSGVLERKITIAAFDFSDTAREQIKNRNGNTLTISELLRQNPQGKNVKILG